jgi:hypothetical protein
MTGYVQQTLALYREGQSLSRVAGLQGAVQQQVRVGWRDGGTCAHVEGAARAYSSPVRRGERGEPGADLRVPHSQSGVNGRGSVHAFPLDAGFGAGPLRRRQAARRSCC